MAISAGPLLGTGIAGNVAVSRVASPGEARMRGGGSGQRGGQLETRTRIDWVTSVAVARRVAKGGWRAARARDRMPSAREPTA